MVNYTDVIMVECCGHKQRKVFEQTRYRGYQVVIFSDVFQDFHFVVQ